MELNLTEAPGCKIWRQAAMILVKPANILYCLYAVLMFPTARVMKRA